MRKIYTLFFVFAFLPGFAHAATISIVADPNSPGVGDTFLVTVQLSSAEAVNAFSGSLVYAAQNIQPVAIRDGDSIVSAWITEPKVATSSAAISFAGLTPGGYVGRNGTLFSVLFVAKKNGQTSIRIASPQVLKNDGAGTSAQLSLTPLALFILAKGGGGFVEPSDTTPPEPFTPLLAKDPALFNDAWYVAFTAADKGTGVASYEMAERRIPLWPLAWHEVTSPAELTDQYLTSDVYVRATDTAGNTRIGELSRTFILRPYEKSFILILLAVLAFGCVGWRYFRK